MEMIVARTCHIPNLTAAQSLDALPVISDADLHAWTERVLEGSDDSLRRYLLDSEFTVCTSSPVRDGLLSPTTPAATFNLSQLLSPPPSPVDANVLTAAAEEVTPVGTKLREHLDSTCCADIDTSYEELLSFVGITDMIMPLSPEEVDLTLEREMEVEELQEEVMTSQPISENWRSLQQELEEFKTAELSPEAVVELAVDLPLWNPLSLVSRRKQALQSFAATSPPLESDCYSGSSSCSSPPPPLVKSRKVRSSCGRVAKPDHKEKKRLSNRESAARYREKMKALHAEEERSWTSIECENRRLKNTCRQTREEETTLVELLREVEKLRQVLQVRQPC